MIQFSRRCRQDRDAISLAAKTFLTIVICFGIGLLNAEAENDPSQEEGSTVSSQPALENNMLVLDVSGSMWGQLDGVSKIQIARDSMKSLVADWPSERLVGLVAYGHRQKGDCADIETVIPVGTLDKTSLGVAVDRLTPRGMTPLTAAVKHAAEELKYSEQKATVILISDGVETCDLDPCKVGPELESLGVDFTAHVIGFDVSKVEDQKGLRCLAESTGGLFISAANASQLNQALEEVIQAEREMPAAVPEASLTVPPTVIKGTEVRVQIASEQDGQRGYLYLYPEGKEKSISHVRVSETTVGSGYEDATIRLPAQIGKFVIRWENSARQVLAEATVETLEASVALEAPEAATMGTAIIVELIAPEGLDGYVYLYPQGKDKSITHARVQEAKVGTGYQPVEIRLPATPGNFVLKWQSSKKETLAETPVSSTEAEVAISAPSEAVGGTEITVEVEAPDGLQGYVYLYAEGKDKNITHARVVEDAVSGYKPMKFRLPSKPGVYQLKWRSGDDRVLTETVVTATEATVSIQTDKKVPIATQLYVEITAPSGLEGYLYLFAKGKEKSITHSRVSEGSDGAYSASPLRMPATPGEYVVKFKNSRKELLAEAEVEVQDSEISVSVPETVDPEKDFSVELNAPAGIRGYLYLYAKGKEKSIGHYRVLPGSINDYESITVTAPETIGEYELMWLSEGDELLGVANFSVAQTGSEQRE